MKNKIFKNERDTQLLKHEKYSKLFSQTWLIMLLLAVFTWQCKKDDFSGEKKGMCPLVISTDPANGDTAVITGKIITVTFNEAMDPTTFNANTFVLDQGATLKSGTILKQGMSQVSGTVACVGAVATFTPSKLLANTVYTGTITSEVKDLMGNALIVNYSFSFTTGLAPDATIPKVNSAIPANGSTGVAINSKVAATFSELMNPSTINATTFTLKQGTTSVTGVVTYVGLTATFAPAANLTANTVYTATITTGARDISSNALANDYTWSFTTGAIADVIPPTAISTIPLNLATGIAINSRPSVTFSESMDPLTISTSTFTLKQGTNAVLGSVSYVGLVATFAPTANLLANTTYTATITTGVKDIAGNAIASNYTWSFTTGTLVGAFAVDLKSVGRFGIIAGVGVSNNAGFSEIHDMDVGINPGVRSSVTGFPPAIMVNGAIFASDDIAPPGVPAMLVQAKQDLTDAYLFAEGATAPAPATIAGDQGGKTLAPGIYKSTSTLLIQSGNLTLDAQGDANAVWIFQIASDFTTVGGAGGNVILTGNAQAKNVFWQVGSSATIGNFTAFQGNVLALTSITMGTHATVVGRMLARNGSVIMTSTNIITKP